MRPFRYDRLVRTPWSSLGVHIIERRRILLRGSQRNCAARRNQLGGRLSQTVVGNRNSAGGERGEAGRIPRRALVPMEPCRTNQNSFEGNCPTRLGSRKSVVWG